MGRSLVLGLDAGSASVKAVLAEVTAGEPEIVGVGAVPSDGIRKGMVVDLSATATAMQQVVADTERAAKWSGEVRAVLGVSGPHVLSVVGRAEAQVAEPAQGVSEQDVERALNAAGAVDLPDGRQVIHVVPRAYRLDGADGVVDPVGLAGRVLAAEAHLVTVEALPVQNYLRAAVKAGIQVMDYQFTLFAAAEAILTREEKEAGTLVLDFGAGMTGVAIYEFGRLWHVGIIPVGGDHITRDLASILQVPVSVAERLKVERGWAGVDLCPDTSLELIGSSGQKTREMQDKRLAQIIEPRVQEILQMASDQVKACGYDGLFTGGLVLTGGGARLKGLVESAANGFGLRTRIGTASGALVSGPEFSAAVGLARVAARLVQADPEIPLEPPKQEQEKRGGRKSWLGSLFSQPS